MAEQFDVVVIGGGPAGYAAALYGAGAGLNIAVVEKEKVGGTCLHRGCIPAKEYLETASRVPHREPRQGLRRGVGSAHHRVRHQPGRASRRWSTSCGRASQGLMKQRKITTYIGTGRLDADGIVRVSGGEADGVELQGTNVLLGAGSVPRTLPGFDVDGKLRDDLRRSADARHAADARAVVVGGGAIGCEFASALADLGVQVTILEFLPQILTGCDKDAADVVARSFKKRGIDVRTGVEVKGHQPTADGKQTVVTFGEGETDHRRRDRDVGRPPPADRRAARRRLTGRRRRARLRQGRPVDAHQRARTSTRSATSSRSTALRVHPQLAHVGFAEGMLAIKVILGEPAVPLDYGKVPMCIYTYPEVAYVGMTEAGGARKRASTSPCRSTATSATAGRIIVGETDGIVKVIAEKDANGKAGKIIGVHMAGPWVTEQLGQGYLAVNWEATVDEVSAFIQPHPSLSELFGETVLALTGRGLHG